MAPKQVKKAKTKAKRPWEQGSVRTRPVSGIKSLSAKDRNWYDAEPDQIAAAVQQLVITIDNNNQDLREQFMRFARMYGNYESMGFSAAGYDGEFTSNNYPVFNVIQSSVDTLHSKVARDNPKPYFITSGADYFTKLRAEKQTQFVQGVFQDQDLYEIANNKVFRDANIYGTGGIQWELNERTNKIECEWMFIDEIKIDKLDAQRLKPLSIHRCKLVQKEKLLAKYPDKIEDLKNFSETHPDYFKNRETVVEFMVVIESWHLKVEDTPGRHCITTADIVLKDEEYNEDYFPLVLFNYYDKPIGIFGRGIAETLTPAQIEINKILLMIQQAQELQAAPYIAVETGSQVAEDVLLSNNISRMIPYRSGTTPPQFISPAAVAPEIYQHLLWWISSSYQEVGISQTSAGGEKQAGVNSAIAIRTMVDVESSRFIQVSKNWEKFFVNCASIVMKLGKKAYSKNPNFKVTYMDKKSKILKDIPWKKVGDSDDMFIIQCDTISAFPSSAAGRIQTITDFISSGLFSKERGLDLLGLDPDLDSEIKLQTSSLRLCEKRIAEMVEDNIYNHPENKMNLKLALGVSEAYYNQLIIDNCPEERLQLVRSWIDEIVVMLMGSDPQVQMLQQAFGQEPAAPAPTQQAQAGLQPSNQQAA